MGKPHGQGRYAALRLAIAGLRTVQLSILLAVMLLASCSCALALDPFLDINQYAHTAWRIRDGFTASTINPIAQTPDGYLWLGTEFGLVKFDGLHPALWEPPANQHLPAGIIRSLLVARDGTLWIGSTGGLASLKDSRLTQYRDFDREIVFALLEDRDGTVWAGTGGAPSAGKLCAIRDGAVDCVGGDGRFGPAVAGLYEDSRGNLWASVPDGLWKWKPGSRKFYDLPGEPDGPAIAEDENDVLVVGWRGTIYRLFGGKMERYPLLGISGKFRARTIIRARNGELWIGLWHRGLVHVHEGKTDLFSARDGLSGDDVHALFEDREGSVWVSTIDGLDRFRDFAVATHRLKQGLLRNLVSSVLADKNGSVWLSTYGGLNRSENGKIKVPPIGAATNDGMVNGSVPNSLFEDNRGRIWISTLHELGYLDNRRFTAIRGAPAGTVLSMVEDTLGNLWVINEPEGLVRISRQHDVRKISWAELGHKDNASVLSADRRRGGLWMGFFLGSIAYFSDGHVRESYSAADGLGTGRVSDFYFDNEGTLWISTEGGLSRLKNDRLATLTSKNGLPCDTVHWAIEDDDRAMWLYTACGLMRIARSELNAWSIATDTQANRTHRIQVSVFDNSDGVRILNRAGHFHPLVAKNSDGRLWFLPSDGVSVIDPRHLPFNRVPPPVHIEKITADDKSYPLSNGLHLPAQIRNLDIDYTALSLVVPEKVRFRVKLEGQDKDWRELVNVRHVEYTNLPPKHYRFRVLACNNSGVWNEEGATLDFVIPPAWYQTNWFLAACVATFLAMVWGIHELRVWQLTYQFNMRLEERVGERTRIARDLHDTLLQSFQGLMLHFQTGIDLLPGRPAEARKALEIGLDRADQAIAEGRDAVQGLRASTVETNDLASAIRTLGEQLRAEGTNQNSALFDMEVEGTPQNLHPILRDEVYRITGEALRNAFRHARAQRIEVEILYGERWLRLRVRDDGKGIDSKLLSGDGLAGHYGLHGMRERAKLVGGRLAVWSKLDSGTEVEMSIPASTAYAKPARHRSWLFEKLSGKGTDFKETDVKETKTKS
jgi:signal transduction histidine kinase/ligand-binding sensor domain-containing protein